jgi:hypothetical protein
LPRLKLHEVADAAIRAARVGDAAEDVAEVAVNALPVVATSRLLEAYCEAFDEVCGRSEIVEQDPLRRGCMVLAWGLLAQAMRAMATNRRTAMASADAKIALAYHAWARYVFGRV